MKIIWQIKDGKRGHENQSRGLIRALSKVMAVECVEIDTTIAGATWLDYLIGRSSAFAGLLKPDLIIGAGSQAHATILAAGRATRAPTVVMMAPPPGISRLFDLCIVPKHDGRSGANFITTRGVLNLIESSPDKISKQGLCLIGGSSKHHGWDGQQIVEQLTQIVASSLDINWTVTTSRRSPEATSSELSAIQADNLTVVPIKDTDEDWLPSQMATASYVWVTEDSVSMIYEALSSGAKVGILPVPRKIKNSRVIRGVDLLIEEVQVLPYKSNQCDLTTFNPPQPLNEATRIAELVANKFFS